MIVLSALVDMTFHVINIKTEAYSNAHTIVTIFIITKRVELHSLDLQIHFKNNNEV